MKPLFFFALFIFAASAEANQVVLLKDLKERSESTRFNCGEVVYVDVVWEEIPTSDHVLRAEWVGPGGHKPAPSLISVAPGDRDNWASLLLEEPSGLSRLTGFKREGGPLTGDWTVNLFLDDTPLASKSFLFEC